MMTLRAAGQLCIAGAVVLFLGACAVGSPTPTPTPDSAAVEAPRIVADGRVLPKRDAELRFEQPGFRSYICVRGDAPTNGAVVMSKGLERKKEAKKKPLKSKEEKRAEKRAKQLEPNEEKLRQIPLAVLFVVSSSRVKSQSPSALVSAWSLSG
ncbi:MAG: hypothetical protein HGA45_17600 [Chloroflexales bacterium]|nr:hypothetical protein [Chloroflexales bacterium]